MANLEVSHIVQPLRLSGWRRLPVDRDGARRAIELVLREYLDKRLREVEKRDEDCGDDLVAPLVEFTVRGGRRMRSVLAWWGWLACGGPSEGSQAEAAMRACAAIELLQSFALTHDDVMDSAKLRRGAPACHVAHAQSHKKRGYHGEPERYGESMAVLVGDLALTWADDLLNESLSELPDGDRARQVWRDLRTELMVGQFLDLRSQARGERSEATALRIDRLKTASYTVERPLHLGAAMAGASEATVAALRGYGADVGVAFQLRDDLLDAFGAPEHTGRPMGEDLREGKNTVLLALGLELAERAGDRDALRVLRSVGHREAASPVEAARALESVGAREQITRRCAQLAVSGLGYVKELNLPIAVGEGLEGFARTAGSV